MELKHVCMCILQNKEEQNAMELKYQNELTAHVKLSSLYKVNNNDILLIYYFVNMLTEFKWLSGYFL